MGKIFDKSEAIVDTRSYKVEQLTKDQITMENKQKSDSRARSRAYPRYDIDEAIKFIEVISRLGGNRVASEAVAAELKKGTNNSTFIGRVSSAKQFDLIIQEAGKLSLSPLGKSIVLPLGDAEKREAIKKAFSTPVLYTELISAFNGKVLPDVTALSNRLVHDYNIESGAKEVAARNFVRSANYAGVMQNGILVVGIGDSVASDETIDSEASVKEDMVKSPATSGFKANKEDYFVFDFAGGIKLVVPQNELTSDAIADGELKEARKALASFADKFVKKTDEAIS